MKQMDDKELKQVLLNILIEFDKICKENDIKYSLCGGTLIGAIRHKGFIPWDDDIDVIMTKDNYDKLLSIVDNYSNERFKFVNNDINDEYYYPFLKLIDSNTYVEEKYKPIKDYGLYIDIFYYVNVPNNKIKLKLFWYKMKYYKFLISGYAFKNTEEKVKHKFVKMIGKSIAKIYGLKRIIRKYDKTINKYNGLECKSVMDNWPCYDYSKEFLNKNSFNDYESASFENHDFLIFKEYDSILKNMYGDYMQLPDEKDRVNHGLKGYWR